MPPVHLMLKPASAGCNLRCKYCFYADEAACRAEGMRGMMTRETAALAAGYCLMLPQDAAQGETGAQAVSVKEGDTQVQFSEAETPGELRRRLAGGPPGETLWL